ncbi:hypothetical protein GCM10010967_28400 [Dyadobacter beijingensis]|uniref:DUF3823 domain-containing protein n=1 Tax=Dyadobacter beijingensis TaxID=365489 RepID=A0ABQ2HZP6_9BACT|nr:DUF3823 domain-containing protein [Dyadobacter beijingensis]GGM93559.1 hypothetical protein GCM10010967_28400 [Dyadobacter beijingensis]
MKSILYILLIPVLLCACKIDDVDAPDSTFEGKLVDAGGNGIQLEQGASSARLKMEELSWSNAPLPLFLNLKQDGSFINNKLFAGNYRVTPVEGPFYPVAEKTVDIQGSTKLDFTVIPYLNVNWVGEPALNADKKLSVSFKFQSNPAPEGLNKPNPLDYQLFISTNQYVGNNNWDNTAVGAVVPVTAAREGENITITSSVPMKYSTTYYVRVGVRVNDTYKKYNYTTIKTVQVP